MLVNSLLRLILAHGAIIKPISRNAVDRHLIDNVTQMYGCNCGCNPDGSGAGGRPCTASALAECGEAGERTNMTGQPCLWFSQGCGIGCDACDNHTQHSNGKPMCTHQMEPTLPKSLWTVNRYKQEDPAKDAYRYHPWRAPGFAPVVDVCGMAGGSPNPGGGAAVFTQSRYAKQGDLGSYVLPKSPSGTVWTAGSAVEVSWGVRANHGGGYQFRLCAAAENLTETCMQKMPLPFALGAKSFLQYNDGSTGASFEPVDVHVGTKPAGSTWRMNPIPGINQPSFTHYYGHGKDACNVSHTGIPLPTGRGCMEFEPIACDEDAPNPEPWRAVPGYGHPAGPELMGKCSGNLINAAVVDQILIPHDTPPGEYVLGFRWDCEESAQVWSSCSDVTIAAA